MNLEISDKQIDELRQICELEFKHPFSIEETRIMANNLVNLYACLRDISQQPDIRTEFERVLQEQLQP